MNSIKSTKILITGASGFIGQYLSKTLENQGYPIVSALRSLSEPKPEPDINSKQEKFLIGNIDADTQWKQALVGVDVVVHLAARVHVMDEKVTDPLSAFRLVNTEGTLNLARQAIETGAKRFIYLSSIKVNGESTARIPFTADDKPNPQDPYAISKFEAEQQLLALGQETDLEIVIIRPPLVYGANVKGNFKRLIGLINQSVPLPLSGINNARSLVSIDNLCSFISSCLTHPQANNEVFLVSDGDDLSTTQLFQKIAKSLNKSSYLFYLPKSWIKFIANLVGKQAEYDRLFGSLQVDITKNTECLNWKPEVSVDEGIHKSCQNACG